MTELEKIDAQITAIRAKYRALADDNPDSMRYHQRDQGGSTYMDYEEMFELQPLLERRRQLRA